MVRGRHHPHRRRIRGAGYFSRLGPGIITGAADDDPSGIATYAQTGAAYGTRLLWTGPYVLPLAFAVQEACARIAIVTGAGLAATIRDRLPRWVLAISVLAVAIANTVNIAADLSSMIAAAGLFAAVPHLPGVVLLAVAIAASEILLPYRRYARYLRWLTLSLIAYVAVLAAVKLDWADVVRSTIVPAIAFDRPALIALIAILGTTISPYLFFWQAAEEAEEEAGKRIDVSRRHVHAMRGDGAAGMVSAVAVMFAIMAASAATLHTAGVSQIDSAEQAAAALQPIAGDAAGWLFALGIIGTGLLAVPVLAGSTAYAASEMLGWRERRGHRPRVFAIVVMVSMVLAIAINALGVPPFRFLYIAAIVNGLAAPLLIGIVWWLSRDRRLMGRWASGRTSQALLLLTLLAMMGVPMLWLLAP